MRPGPVQRRVDRRGGNLNVNVHVEPPTEQHVVTAPRDYRKEVWIKVAAATAAASNCVKDTSPGRFADQALKDFDATFGNTQ